MNNSREESFTGIGRLYWWRDFTHSALFFHALSNKFIIDKFRMNEIVTTTAVLRVTSFLFRFRISRMRTINPTHTNVLPCSYETPEKYSSWRLWWDPWSFKAQNFSLASIKIIFFFFIHPKKKILTVLAIFSCMCVRVIVCCVYLHCSSLPFFSITSHLCTRIHWTLELTSHPFMFYARFCSFFRFLRERETKVFT